MISSYISILNDIDLWYIEFHGSHQESGVRLPGQHPRSIFQASWTRWGPLWTGNVVVCGEIFLQFFFFYRIFRQMMFYHNDVSLPESTSWLRLDYVWSVEEHLRSSSVSIGFHRPHPSMSTDPRCVILLCAGHFGLTLCQAGWQWWGADTNVTSGCCSKAGWDWLRSGGVPLYNKTTTTWNVYANICIYYM